MDPRNFLVISDYPLDKIIYLYEGQLTAAAGGFATASIPHDLPFAPLIVGNWSTSPLWSVTYEQQSGPIAPNNNYSPILYGFDVTSNNSASNITLTNYISGAPVTAYYRLYGFQPSNSNVDLLATNDADNFILNTEYNYTKLLSANTASIAESFSIDQFVTVTHNLGYIPQVIYWIERSNLIERGAQTTPNGSAISCRVTSDSVIFKSSQALAATLHYRIYIDE